MMQSNPRQLAIIGGGAAGFFSAICAAEKAKKTGTPSHISIFESSHQYLKKVRISGGGRCNVTHNLFDVRAFTENYPRGARELLSPFQQFQAEDTVAWFKKAGVELIAENDGRMFPNTNSSQTIIDCYLDAVKTYGIQLIPKSPVKGIVPTDSGQLELHFRDKQPFTADSVLIATGSASGGYELAQSLGHTITERAPSLFSFKIQDSLISALPGMSFPHADLKLKLPGKKVFKQKGPTLITHWGLSGPAVLKLSAWAAREMKRVDYKALLIVNWLGSSSLQEVENVIRDLKQANAKSFLKNIYPTQIAKRFWLSLLDRCRIDSEKQWANLNKKEINQIATRLFSSEFKILGQNRFKDEFVECGGVSLKEINFKTMESKICPGVYFAGEILDVDGITGGFNFQNAWTTGWIAAQAMAKDNQ